MSRTTIDIDDDLIQQAMSVTKARTKTEVIEAGLRELIRKKNLSALRKKLGTFQFNMTVKEFWRMRHGR